MRWLVLSVFVGLSLSAFAQEGELLAPRIRVPGEKAAKTELKVSSAYLEKLGMLADDIEAVKAQVAKLNSQRAELLKQLKAAQEELAEAKRKVASIAAQLHSQERTLENFIQERLPADKRADYPIRAQLQGVIDWLGLGEDQVQQLIAKQKELLANDPRAELRAKARELTERPAGQPLTAEQRKEHIALLKRVAEFNQKWLANIESVLTDEQKRVWRTRFRRTMLPVGLGGTTP